MNKITRNKNRDFTIISNVFLRDKELSIKAKGFLAVIMGLPDDWEFTINGICRTLKEGKTAIYNVINELKDRGYCQVNICRDEKGVILGNDYKFYEEPQIENQHSDEPHTENPNADNQPQLSTNYNNNEEKEERTLEGAYDWRKNYDCYLQIVNDAKLTLINDNDFFEKMQKYYPNANYDLTIERMVEMYWGTQAGWNNKKKSRSKSIDMIATLKNNFGRNIVYKAKGQSRLGFRTERSDDDLIINGVKYQ